MRQGIFDAMWSEHCSYKSSRRLLERLPMEGERGENAGIVALDDEWAIAFKIESHNHPSAIDPYQGAATGVGGILRDIFAMGARPIALLDSLHFGSPRSPHFDGVISGIADYGNCVGVPVVADEIRFHPGYESNPLVNVMAVGLVRRDRIAHARATTAGSRVLYYGSPTGRDGIHGATFSSGPLDISGHAVQIADPFMGKKVMEATLELVEAGVVEAIADMGAAGLTCASCEMAARGGTGIRINLDRVPRREEGMTPYEMMLSESQERMLAVVSNEHWERAESILSKWELGAFDIGEINATKMMEIFSKDESHVAISLDELMNVPIPNLEAKAPDRKESIDREEASIDLASIRERFDYMVGARTLLKTVGGKAAVLRAGNYGIAMTTHSDVYAAVTDPRRAAMLVVVEAARRIACTGARPTAITNCLNFGDPTNPEIYWQLSETIDGMAEACRELETPVTGGNVSLNNDIPPTLVVGMIGIIEDYRNTLSHHMIGKVFLIRDAATFPDWKHERLLHAFLVEGAALKIIHAAHSSDGGIRVCGDDLFALAQKHHLSLIES